MIDDDNKRPAQSWSNFFGTALDSLLARHLDISAEQEALTLFHSVAATVPAYQRFLEAQRVDPARVTGFAAFQTLPLTTKNNYMRAYPLPQLCREGRLAACETIAASSGSTGTPMFWPRALAHELSVAVRFEQVLRDSFHADERSTLVVVCFALGTWVGGMYTAQCMRYLAQKGYPLTVVTPGNNKTEIFRTVRELGPHYDQVVLAGYPPFLKDVIDEGRVSGMEWPRYRVKLILAGEVFSEEWRALVCERLGANDPRYDTASLYGTADGGVLGNETPLSIAVRRFFAHHPQAAQQVFGESRLPTLVQYDPLSRLFETHEGTLVVTGDSGVPLVRYHIADRGGVISYQDMLRYVQETGGEGFEQPGPHARGMRALPFVFVFGRADFTVSFYGANVYPENIAVGLEQPGIRDWVTGKFVMEVVETTDQDRELRITVELASTVSAAPSLEGQVADAVQEHVTRLNSEFANYVPEHKQRPVIRLKMFADPDYFPPGVKHRYTKKLP